jgi:cytochrome c-type biogenesis protein CcmH
MRRFVAMALLTGLFFAPAGAISQSAKTMIKDPALAKRFNKVSDDLVCQCGCNMGLRVCNHENCPSAIPMRHEIETQLQAGATNDSIASAFVKEYGEKVLAEPPATGFNLAAYVMPGFAVLVGLFIVATFASRWTTKRRLAAAPATPIDPELRERIERELRS